MNSLKLSPGLALGLTLFATVATAQYNVLWWDSTPEYGAQAPNALRQEMSDYLNAHAGGTVFNSTYVGSETPGDLASHLASHSYQVLVFDATSSNAKFNAADLSAIQSFYQAGYKNLLLDGTLYIRSINYDSGSDFPGTNEGTGGLTVNEVYSIATRGGGIMIGTDHSGFQVDANQVLQAILPGASFSGITYPSTDGVFYGPDLLAAKQPIAPVDVFNHWDSIDTQAIAPTGAFNDFLGASRTLYSLVDVADEPGGGVKHSYIAASWQPGEGETDVDDPDTGVDDPNAVPDNGTTLALIGSALFGLAMARRRR